LIKRVTVILSWDDENIRPAYNWSYMLYGTLTRRLSGESAELLHEQERPYVSHYLAVERDERVCVWLVTLFDGAPADIASTLSRMTEYDLEKPGARMKVRSVDESPEISESDLCREYLAKAPPGRQATLDFLSPCAFKSAGEYVIMPSKELILQSCVNRWNLVSSVSRLDDPEVLSDIVSGCRITRYRLQSASYDMKNVKIPSFIGRVTMSARGPDPLIRLFRLLMAFAGYAGVGIKTALGMGGCKATLDGDKISPSPANRT
jgi:CRISPR-associated endoribonuclease Cas6